MKSTLLALSLVTLVACESIAPKGSPRVEVELETTVDAEFLGALVNVSQDSELVAAIRRAVQSEADLGLRFYATPAEAYSEGDTRPEYQMTVDVTDLMIEFDNKMIEAEGQEPRIESSVGKIRASVSTAVLKRRANGPPLTVASGEATAMARPETQPEAIEAETGYEPKFDSATLKVLERDILKAVQAAADRAMRSMLPAIDREFAPPPAAAETSNS